MTTQPGTVVHLAGPAQHGGAYQGCARCGYVLQDYTGHMVMVPEGLRTTISCWQEGARIGVSGNATWAYGGDVPLEPGEVPCHPAS